MNILARAKLSSHFILSFSSQSRCRYHLASVTTLQQRCNFFATKAAAHSSQKTQQLTKPKTHKPSEPSTTFSQRVKKQVEALNPVWPKPREIPYQAKVANFVNLIGFVKIPVQFETDSDGKHFATTVVNIGNVNERNSLVIPVLFEGDLAHVVSCHVKKNDCVFVSGQLSAEPLGLALSDGLGKFHVVAENLNFVEGYKKVDVSFSGGFGIEEIRKNANEKKNKIEVVVEETIHDDQQLKKTYESVKEKGMVWSNFANINVDAADTESLPQRGGDDGTKWETDSMKNGPRVNKKKDADEVTNLWRDLVRNPLQWWDYRDHKAKGLVKEKFPDFKQKVTDEALWISSAPQWVLPGIKMLEFDVKEMKPKQFQGREAFSGMKKNNAKSEENWKSLVENPDQWWDNRVNKKNPKAPDFKHKETGEVVWLNTVPDWVLSKLPPTNHNQMKM